MLEFRNSFTDEISAALQSHVAILGKLTAEDESSHPVVPPVKFAHSQKMTKPRKPGSRANSGVRLCEMQVFCASIVRVVS